MSYEAHKALDFCLTPIGTGESSVSPTVTRNRGSHDPMCFQVAEHIAECHRVLEKSGLTFKASIVRTL